MIVYYLMQNYKINTLGLSPMKWTGNHLCVFVNIINQKSIIPILKKKAKYRHTDWQSRTRIQVWCMLKLITIPLIRKIVCLTYLNGMELNVETTGIVLYIVHCFM